jgi:hypothetical protein
MAAATSVVDRTCAEPASGTIAQGDAQKQGAHCAARQANHDCLSMVLQMK